MVLLPDVYYREGDWAPFDMKTAFGDHENTDPRYDWHLTPDRARDADALLNYLASRPGVIGDRFIVCGGRMSVVAGRLPDRVAAAALSTVWWPTARTARTCWPTGSNATVYIGGAENDRRSPPTTPRKLDRVQRGRRAAPHRSTLPGRHGFLVRTIRLMTPQPTNAIGRNIERPSAQRSTSPASRRRIALIAPGFCAILRLSPSR